MNPETKVQNAALLAVGQRPDALAMRLHVGKYRAMNNPDQIISVGTPGWPDTLVLVEVEITPEMVGKRICVAGAGEIKTPKGRQADVQRAWQQAFEARGGVYRLVRDPEEMVGLVEDLKHGRW